MGKSTESVEGLIFFLRGYAVGLKDRGDDITSSIINTVLDRLEFCEKRIAELEAKGE